MTTTRTHRTNELAVEVRLVFPAGECIGTSPKTQRTNQHQEGLPGMATGTVASIRDKGFGFIAPDGAAASGDIFFHRTAMADGSFDQLVEGQRVSFDEEPDPRDSSRRRAVNVRVLSQVTSE